MMRQCRFAGGQPVFGQESNVFSILHAPCHLFSVNGTCKLTHFANRLKFRSQREERFRIMAVIVVECNHTGHQRLWSPWTNRGTLSQYRSGPPRKAARDEHILSRHRDNGRSRMMTGEDRKDQMKKRIECSWVGCIGCYIRHLHLPMAFRSPTLT